jgi:hypothetical protein
VITAIVTFLTEKIVAVVITTVVVVAAVPTLIVAINGNTITITTGPVASSSRHHDEDERARLILEVKTAGDAVIVKIDHEEATCASQIDQLASQSTLSASATRAALDKGKGEFHTATLNFRKEIKDNEDELEHLSVITTETQQTFLVHISTVQVTAFGHDGHSGTLITVCQTILVEIRTIVVVVVHSGGEEDDD